MQTLQSCLAGGLAALACLCSGAAMAQDPAHGAGPALAEEGTRVAARPVDHRFPLATGEMLLRDAMYLYNTPIYSGYLKSIFGIECDILQLVLDVESGKTDISMYTAATSQELDSGSGTQTDYPDTILQAHYMFSYALYGSTYSKAFGLAEKAFDKGSTVIGNATAFVYCFSDDPSAHLLYSNGLTGEIQTSAQVNP